MGYELLEVFPWLFDFSGEDDGLLHPVRCLHKIVDLVLNGHLFVGVPQPETLGPVPCIASAYSVAQISGPTPSRKSPHDILHHDQHGDQGGAG